MVFKKKRIAVLAAVAGICAGIAPVHSAHRPVPRRAQLKRGAPPVLTGAAAIHTLRFMNGRYCFDGHVHYGESSGMASLQAARAEAIKSWFDLVDIEYGGEWSSFSNAAAKSVKCASGTGGWGCEVHAIPCR